MFGIKKRLTRLTQQIIIDRIKKMPLNKLSGLNNENREKRIIVSLTSYPARFSELYIVIRSLLLQSMKPDKIILYLGSDSIDTPLPQELLRLKKCGLTISYKDEDLKPHKKYFYAMQEYPNDIIITVDDDGIYSRNTIRDLYNTYCRFPSCIIARRVNLICFQDSMRLPYIQWKLDYMGSIEEERFDVLAVGVGGCLYPPQLLNNRLFDKEFILENCIRTDDLWLKYIELLSCVPVVKTKAKKTHPISLSYADATGLAKDNVLRNNNDISLDRIEQHEHITLYEIIEKCKRKGKCNL